MPRGVNTGYKCDESFKNKSLTPLPHQEFASNYFLNSPHKSMLFEWALGSGKSLGAHLTASKLIESKKINKVYVIAPGSLRSNWIEEFCKSMPDKSILSSYTFITYNYNVISELPKNFNNALVIIDEVHNFINSVKNQSKNAEAIYARLMMSKCRILALSGTPIYDKYWEWSLLGNLLKPGAFPNVIVDGHVVSENFTSLFDKQPDGTLVPKSPDFEKALEGIVSYVPGVGEEFYPQVIYEEPIKIVMTPQQQAVYINDMAKESKILSIGPPEAKYKYSDPEWYALQSQLYIMAKKHILSRQPSNFVYPKQAYEIIKIGKKEVRNKLSDDLKPNGWVAKKYFKAGKLASEYSSKVTALLRNILTPEHYGAKHMVFSFFKEKSGVNIIKALLEMCGVKVATFTGDLSDKKRTELLHIFNSPANRYGKLIKIVLATDSVKEGISLLETQHVHILESDDRENKIAQVIGRVARYKSHYNMPKKLQKVHVWRYWSVLPPEMGGEETIDVVLYKQGQVKLKTINSFLDLLKKNSIEKKSAEFPPGLTIHYEDYELPLSENVIKCVEDKGYKFVKKIGEGSYSDVFLGLDKNGEEIVILIKGNACHKRDNIYEIFEKQKEGILDTKYMIKIINVIECNYRYSDDPRWYPKIKFTNPIQILEYAPILIIDYIRNQRKKGVNNPTIMQKIISDLTEAYEYIHKNGYSFVDLKDDNLIYDEKDDRIKFIDLETLRKFDPGMALTNGEIIEIVKYMVTDASIEKKSAEFPPGLTIHYYDEENDKTYELPLSENVIKCVEDKGYKFVKKIGEGGSADAFLGLDSNGKEIVILIKGNLCERIDNIYEIFKKQKEGILDTRYMIKIINVIECNYKYSDDPRWCPDFQSTNPIQILEYAPISVDQYIENQRKKGVNDKNLKKKIASDLIEAYEHIHEKGYSFWDLSEYNLIYDEKDDRIKFIDLETFEKFDPRRVLIDDSVIKTIKDLIDEINERTIDKIYRYGNQKKNPPNSLQD